MLLIILSHLNSIDDKRNYPLGNFKHILFYFNSFPPELSTALTESAVRQSGKAHIFSLIGFFSLKQPVDSEIPERAIGFSLRANPTISIFFCSFMLLYRQFRRLCRQQKKAEIRNVIKFQISRLF